MLMIKPIAQELFAHAKKNIGRYHSLYFDDSELDVNLNQFLARSEQFQKFRDDVSRLLDSGKLDLEPWLMELNRLSCEMRFGRERMTAAKLFEQKIWEHFRARNGKV